MIANKPQTWGTFVTRHPRPMIAMAMIFISCLMMLTGCLDVPSDPSTSQDVSSIQIYITQSGQDDSTFLKIRPSDPATLHVKVRPRNLEKKLTYEWVYLGASKKPARMVLGNSKDYKISRNSPISQIPNRLEITDPAGNQWAENFNIVINRAPILDSIAIPAPGDTLYGNSHTGFRFQWSAVDYDSDTLKTVLRIDKTNFDVGPLESVIQSGLTPGMHSYRIIVRDRFGDADTLHSRTFYVVDPEEDDK